jgi:hypothetical protein
MTLLIVGYGIIVVVETAEKKHGSRKANNLPKTPITIEQSRIVQ